LKNVDKNMCLPFDRDRFGLNLGEGSAYLVLEEKNTHRNAIKLHLISCQVMATSMRTSTSRVFPDGQGAMNAMKLAMQKQLYARNKSTLFIHMAQARWTMIY
jgi:3-oxoacyl-(acyl-carrier-protein) synthase